MADDLGGETKQVHDAADAVLHFWFEELAPELHWEKKPQLDGLIAKRFGALRDHVLATEAAGWRENAGTLLAAIILLDQFSRNIHRGAAEAFAGDALARSLAKQGIERGWDKAMPAERRVFLYMPFMHGENQSDQAQSLALFGDREFGITDNFRYARAHADVFAKFGRFPGRNAALGRTSTPAERAYLSQPDADW